MTVQSLLPEPGRVDEPKAAQDYSNVLSQVVAEGKPVIVRTKWRGSCGRYSFGVSGFAAGSRNA